MQSNKPLNEIKQQREIPSPFTPVFVTTSLAVYNETIETVRSCELDICGKSIPTEQLDSQFSAEILFYFINVDTARPGVPGFCEQSPVNSVEIEGTPAKVNACRNRSPE